MQNSESQKSVANTDYFVPKTKVNLSFTYLSRKCEKISSVLYMITSKISDRDPLKLAIREKAIELCLLVSVREGDAFKNIVSFQDGDVGRGEFAHRFECVTSELTSLLSISVFAGYLSKMNTEVIRSELVALRKFVHSTNEENFLPREEVFPKSFFSSGDENFIGHSLEQAHDFKKDKSTTVPATRKREVVSETGGELRKRLILNIIRDKGQVSIKDVSSQIKDCSEKTIQRILLALVAEGVLIKKGNRRWSVYQFKDTEVSGVDTESSDTGPVAEGISMN